MKNFLNILILFILLLGTWYTFSGYDSLFFLGLGAASCALAIAIGWRMAIIDEERHPIYLKPKAPIYFLWLLKEMFISSVKVSFQVWFPDAKISPTMGWVKSTQTSDEARAIYGNSITLTPGTVCIDIDGNDIEVHALSESSLVDLRKGIMNKNVKESIS